MIQRKRDLKQKINNNDIPQSPSSRDNDSVRISVLSDENKLLRENYSMLLKKTNTIVDAYRRLEAENKTLKAKQNKRESWDKIISGLYNGVNYIIKKIIIWFKS